MNLKQLKAFREVMLTGSVSEAARTLHRTQPAISSLINALEQELGCELFARRSGRLVPMPEAHFLLEEANAILGRVDATERVLKGLRHNEEGTLSIVSMPGPSAFLLPALISQFLGGRDGLKVSQRTRSSPQVQQLLATQQYDVGLADMGFSGAGDTGLINYDIMRMDCLCAMSVRDPLANQDRVTARDLDGRPMATLHAEHEMHNKIAEVFSDANAVFHVRFETQYFIPLFTFIENNQAYAIVDPLSAESYKIYRGTQDRIAFRRFDPAIPFLTCIMTPAYRDLSGIARTFAALLRDHIRHIAANFHHKD